MTTTLDRHDNVVRRFAEACRSGDIAAVRAILDADAIAVCDGGGLVPAAPGLIHGAATSPSWSRSCWAGNRTPS